MAVYFAPQLPLRAVDVGLVWELWRERYPRTEDHPLLPPVPPEAFGRSPLGVSLQIVTGSPGVRTLFLSESGERLAQLQADRLVLNWRRTDDGHAYPRYASLREELLALVGQLADFSVDQGYPPMTISQVEVSYTNPIPAGGDRSIADLLAPWSGSHSDEFLPSPEDVRLDLRYQIPAPDTGEPLGRLYARLYRALHRRAGGVATEEADVLQIFARARPRGDDAGDALDLAHEWVVRGFTSLTTEAMHRLWGLHEEG